MAFGFLNLPKAKWWAALRQVVLKSDFKDIETALLEAPGLVQVPNIAWIDATSIKVPATADCPAAVLMNGFPNILHPGAFVSGALSDGKYRVNVADTTIDLDVAASLWGTEKISQWYLVYALADDADAVFTIKAMPIMRVCSDDEGTKVISLGTLVTPATGRRYGFTTDEFVGGMVYILGGASKGLMRTITANDNASGADGTSGTITYSGVALSLAPGDWFVVLPPTNFRLVGGILNNASGNIEQFDRVGNRVNRISTYYSTETATGVVEDIFLASPLACEWEANVVFTEGIDTQNWIGHPDTNQTTGAEIIKYDADSGSQYNRRIRLPIRMCQIYFQITVYAAKLYPVGYSYPPGCGY